MNNIKSNINKNIDKLKRSCILIHLTNNLGKVVEEEDKIICYVKKSRCKKEGYNYTIPCHGITKKDKALAEKYNLNKPICYIIDGLEFKNHKVYIFGYDNCEVNVRKCTFGFDLIIRINGKCTLENTFIRAFYILSISAKDLLIKNMDIRNDLYPSEKLHIGIDADEKLEINNSHIGRTKEKTKVSIISPKKLEIYNSKIAGDSIECQAEKIISGKKSSIEATKKLDLKTNEFYEINITSPIINYNGNPIETTKKDIILKRTTDPKKIKIFELVELLKKIKNECEQTNQKLAEEYTENLNNQQISRVLKK